MNKISKANVVYNEDLRSQKCDVMVGQGIGRTLEVHHKSQDWTS